jgi:hypothetical protein
MHLRRPHKGEALTADRVGDCSKEVGHRRFPYPSPFYVVISRAIPSGSRTGLAIGARV